MRHAAAADILGLSAVRAEQAIASAAVEERRRADRSAAGGDYSEILPARSRAAQEKAARYHPLGRGGQCGGGASKADIPPIRSSRHRLRFSRQSSVAKISNPLGCRARGTSLRRSAVFQLCPREIIMAKKPTGKSNPTIVSEQTAGGITGAVIGGMVAGPVGAVVGGVAGAMVGNSAAKGEEPVKKALETVRSAGKRGVKAIKAVRGRSKPSSPAKKKTAKPAAGKKSPAKESPAKPAGAKKKSKPKAAAKKSPSKKPAARKAKRSARTAKKKA